MTDSTQQNSLARFADIDLFPKDRPPLVDFDKEPLVDFDQALKPIHEIINGLPTMAKAAIQYCYFPDKENDLSKDESASIYLYTMDDGSPSFYKTLNKTLRGGDQLALKPWLLYLKLLDTAFKKLPNKKENVWRGIDRILDENAYFEERRLIWWGVDSCSRKRKAAEPFLGQDFMGNYYGTLFFIEAINGKDVQKYSRYPNEEEIILIPGSRLLVLSNTVNRSGKVHHVHMREITDNDFRQETQELSSASRRPVKKFGSLKLSDDILYMGEIVDGKPHGHGTATSPQWGRYEGKWQHGLFHGQGSMERTDGTKYVGGFIQGNRSGEGVLVWPNEKRYEGAWENNQTTGPGRFFDETGRLEYILTNDNIHLKVPGETKSATTQTEKEDACCLS